MSEDTLPSLNTSLRLLAATFRQASRMSEPHVLCSGLPVHVLVPVPVQGPPEPPQTASERGGWMEHEHEQEHEGRTW
jgi:hypothetical protein